MEDETLHRVRVAFLDTKPAFRADTGKNRETTRRALNTEDDIANLIEIVIYKARKLLLTTQMVLKHDVALL